MLDDLRISNFSVLIFTMELMTLQNVSRHYIDIFGLGSLSWSVTYSHVESGGAWGCTELLFPAQAAVCVGGWWEGASPSTGPDLEIPQILSSLATFFPPLNGDLFLFHLLKERICFHVEHTSTFYCWEREEK